MTKIRYYTFSCSHPLANYIQKVVTTDGTDPRMKMIRIWGSNWSWEYFPEHDEVVENEDGTVTIHGKNRDYTYKLLDKVL